MAAIETGIKDAVAAPDVRARFEQTGAEMRSGSADEMAKRLAGDLAKWSRLVQEQHIRIAP